MIKITERWFSRPLLPRIARCSGKSLALVFLDPPFPDIGFVPDCRIRSVTYDRQPQNRGIIDNLVDRSKDEMSETSFAKPFTLAVDEIVGVDTSGNIFELAARKRFLEYITNVMGNIPVRKKPDRFSGIRRLFAAVDLYVHPP